MSSAETLSKHLYDAGKGDVKTAVIILNNATEHITIATPATDKRIAILFLAVMPSTVDNKVDLSWFVDSTETAIFTDLHVNTAISPIILNFESCPIVGPANGVLKGVNSGGGNNVYITMNYVELS